MKRRTEKSVKRTKTIVLIIIIAALISITGTYAWFSSQRDVEIVGFKLNVEIAENLEISLDGETWVHSINIENMRQFYGTYVDFSADSITYQAKTDDNKNYVPTELLPVSTIGAVEDGNLIFAIGEVKDRQLSKIKRCTETDIVVGAKIIDKEKKNKEHPYMVFDMYLRNLSRLDSGDVLQLDDGSYVIAGKEGTGLENSVRVGFVQHTANTIAINYQEADVGQKVRALAPSEDDSEKVAIWEPNSKFHTAFVVANDDRITNQLQEFTTRAVAVTKSGVPKTTIDDIRSETETALKPVAVNTPKQSDDKDKIGEGTTEEHDLVCTDGTKMTLAGNAITKVRCYIWLEGQDPDCIDLSSTGDEVEIALKLTKPQSKDDAGNSYAEPNTQ